MSFELGRDCDRDDLERFPKVARQHALASRGLPVPPGVVLDLARARQVFARHAEAPGDDPAHAWVRGELDGGRRLIARSAGIREDTEEASGAGMGLSVAGLKDLAGVDAALAMIEAHGRSLGLEPRSDPGASRTLILIQREIPRRALLVVVREGEPDERFYAEVHGPQAGPEPLAEGRSPDWSGPLADWPDDSRAKVEALAATVAASEGGPFGTDLEIVVDPEGEAWLVQARPLTAPLHPGWPAFREAVERAGERGRLTGRLTLDGEHNPTPLSPAHAWVMKRLAELRPGKSGDPVILAGWLYVRALPRELGRRPTKPPMSAEEALSWLREQALPRARAELERFEAELAKDPPVAEGLARAEELFLAMIDDYVERLVPARRAALKRAELLEREARRDPSESSTALTLRGRGAYLDVLPAIWDIASPSLAELLTRDDDQLEALADREALPRDEIAQARLLGEWDDHLFALGLAPLRRLWSHAGARLGLVDADVFLLTGDEIVALDRDRQALGDEDQLRATLAERAARWTEQAELDPPGRIVDGHPLPHPMGGQLRGLAIGESFTGPLAQRRDLRDLLADPPAPGSVLCIPALTAQAAVALHRLGVRAVCTEYGGALAHGVLMARELGLSALIGCRGCTALVEGSPARLDTRVRRLIVLERAPLTRKTS